MPASVINPETFEDEWFGGLSDREMIVWLGLITSLRDDQGRLVENAALTRSRLFPYRDVPVADVQAALDRFVTDGRLFRYEAEGRALLQIVNWWRYQRLQWAAPSRFPAPAGWTDRVRNRCAGKYQSVNWNEPGGFADVQVNRSGEPFSRSLHLKGSEPEPEPEPIHKRLCAKTRRVSAVSPEEWERREGEAMTNAWFPGELRQLGGIMAEANKSGTVALSRLVRDLYEPLVALQAELSREEMRYGMQAAISKGAPNVTYVRKAALNYHGRPSGNGSRARTLQERIDRLTEYDKQALDDPDLRGPFLERFGSRLGITEEEQ